MPDYMYQLESRLSPEQRAVMIRVQELSQETRLNLYLTGGAVRDLISGMAIRDLDFTVEGNPARISRELEKGGARVIYEEEKKRHWEFIFAGDVDGSLEESREDFYSSPGGKPEIRWASITDDLRRRDFSVNAIAISLNQASRGLLLDPMNGLADLERKEVRSLSIHSFTNQPVRLLRALFYCARLGLKLEQRTGEWFDLAISRGLQDSIDGAAAGLLVRQLCREENPGAILKAWDSRKLLGSLFPALGRRKPNLEDFARLAKAREAMSGAGIRPRLFPVVVHYLIARLPSREQAAAIRHWGFSAVEHKTVQELSAEAHKFRNLLQSPKLEAPEDAYRLLVRTSPAVIAFVLTEWSTSGAAMRIRNYLTKWHPLRLSLPVAELTALGVPSGPRFDEILDKFFVMQLRGRARDPEERPKILKKLAGIKDEPPKKPKPDKGGRKVKATEAAPPAPGQAALPPAPKSAPAPKAERVAAKKKAGRAVQSAVKRRKLSRKPRTRKKSARKPAATNRRRNQRANARKAARQAKAKRARKRTKSAKKKGRKRR